MSAAIIARLRAGEISPRIAMAQMLLQGSVPDPERLAADGHPELARLARLGGLDGLAALARSGIDPGGEDMVAATAALFDRMAAVSPEAAVAFYSLGDAALLDEATTELAAVIRDWAPVAGRDVLDLGCGIGRVARALAGEARSVLGVDVSAAMVAEARARGEGARLRFVQGSGRDLAVVADDAIDLIVAADSFPYVVRAGAEVLDRHMAEAVRVLRAGGDLLVFNWSYRGDAGADAVEAAQLAERHGFAMVRSGERPFAIWDGIGFHLRRPA